MGHLWLALGLLLCGADPVPTVSVDAARLRLGMLVPELRAPWADLDLGPAPQPLQSRLLSRAQMEARVRGAGLQDAPVPLPPRLRVTRLGQRLSEPELHALVQGEVLRALPQQVTLRRLVVSGNLLLARGTLQVEVPDLRNLRSGQQSILVRLSAQQDDAEGEVQGTMVPALLDVEVPASLHQAIVSRGQHVQVVINQGAVHLQSGGTAQQSGRAGDWISVMPQQGSRVLQAKVIDSRTVEVLP